MPQITFKIQGSTPEPYTVQFEMDNSILTVKCDCPAGSIGQLCKHRLNLFAADASNIIGNNQSQLNEALQWYTNSRISKEMLEMSILENEMETVKKKISNKKKQIARMCDGH